jgi:hypothetical protein
MNAKNHLKPRAIVDVESSGPIPDLKLYIDIVLLRWRFHSLIVLLFALKGIERYHYLLSSCVFTEYLIPPTKNQLCDGGTGSIHNVLNFVSIVALLPSGEKGQPGHDHALTPYATNYIFLNSMTTTIEI